MNEYDILRSPDWACQWTCRSCGERNEVRRQDVSQRVSTPRELAPHLTCRTCQTNVGDIAGRDVIVLFPTPQKGET